MAVWGIYPIFDVKYWLWPSSLIDWGFVFGFIFLAAAVTLYGSGLLAAWWVSFPAHVTLAHYVYSQNGFVVLPFQNDLLSYVVISAAIASIYAVVGYLLGIVCRWVIDRPTFNRSEGVDG